MSYLDEFGLSVYGSNLKEWVSSQNIKTIPSSIYPWVRTAKASVVSCYPVGGTELKPVVDFLFTETPPASGDKGPGNPSTITGINEVIVVQKNKNLSIIRNSKTHNGVTFTSNGDGTYTVNGTASGGNASLDLIIKSNKVPAITGKPVIPSGCPSGGSSQTYSTYVVAYDKNGTWKQSKYDEGDPSSTRPLIPNQDGVFVYSILIKNGTTVSNLLFKPQLEYSDVVTTFEEPNNTAYTISFGSTYYGGTFDVASGVMTVTHAVVEPEASTVDISSASAALPLDYADTFGRTITSADGTSLSVGSTGGTVVYKLATPQIVTLTSTEILSLSQTDKYTPRLNTVYTDAQIVQVGYIKSPIREEYELTQAIVAQGGNI